MKAVARPPPRSSHSHSHTQTRQKGSSPSATTSAFSKDSRPPSSAAPAMSQSVTSTRTPGGNASKEPAKASSPNYFGLTVNPSDQSDSGVRPKGNWSPPTSSIRSFNAQTPKHIPVEANSDFEAFRRQSEANHSFSLSHGNLSYFASTPGVSGRNGSNAGLRGGGEEASVGLFDSKPKAPTAIPNNVPAAQKESQSFFDMPRQESPMSMLNMQLPSLAGRKGALTDMGNTRHHELSLPGHRSATPTSPHPHRQAQRSETLPSVLEEGPAMITPETLRKMLRELPVEKYLLLDLRVAPQYAQARIKGALSLCIPTTLLKRPSFNLAKLTDTFKAPEEHARFCQWKECEYVILYDASSAHKKDALAAMNTIKKFTNEGWEGKACIVKGGFQAFSQVRDEFVDTNSAHGAQSSNNLSLGSLVPDVAPVAGGCQMPESKGAANPFFSNIRQNMDLVGGVGQIDLKRPNNANISAEGFLPPWLSKAAAVDDHGKAVSDKFLHIEQEELSRMRKALSSRVSYGTPNTGAGKDIQIAGFEKGSKNRYNNIWPFEHSRVRLQGRSDAACDYVNASHIKPSWSNKRYIASQGPLPATFEDFWSVIWDQNVRVIVMLTAESEGGQLKCHPYWEAQAYGQFRVRALSEKKVSLDPHNHRRSSTNVKDKESAGRRRANTTINEPAPAESPSSSTHPHVVVRKMALTHSSQPFAPMREITQLHYSAWPDFGAPAQPSHLLSLVELSNSIQRGSLPPGIAAQTKSDEPESVAASRPILVHCSAGCGRTGTFCTVDSVIDMLKRQRKEKSSGVTPMELSSTEKTDYMGSKGDIDSDWVFNPNIDLIEHTVEDFRKQRISMVQSLRQYVLCYETVMEWLNEQKTKEARRGHGERSGSLSLSLSVQSSRENSVSK